MRRAGQQQVGDIRARDQQHERHRAHQRPEDGLDLRPEHAVEKRRHHGRDVLVGVGILLRQLCREMSDISLRACSSVTPSARRP